MHNRCVTYPEDSRCVAYPEDSRCVTYPDDSRCITYPDDRIKETRRSSPSRLRKLPKPLFQEKWTTLYPLKVDSTPLFETIDESFFTQACTCLCLFFNDERSFSRKKTTLRWRTSEREWVTSFDRFTHRGALLSSSHYRPSVVVCIDRWKFEFWTWKFEFQVLYWI